MNVWVERLADADDDYLIGLSNKGIVKRAYKDKEETAVEVVSAGEEAVLKVGSETVTVCFPLGESKCTCPSRSMCRHVVLGILVLKECCRTDGAVPGQEDAVSMEKEAGGGAGQSTDLTEDAVSMEKEAGEEAGQDQAGPRGNGGARQGEELKGDAGPGNDGIKTEKAAGEEAGQDQKQVHPDRGGPEQTAQETKKGAVWREINEYPLEKLKKALGSRGYASFVNQACADIRPEMNYSSVITVRLPEQDYTVKLLSPLAYSSCTCHKKELCVHKAAAILWCQLETKILTKEHLLGEAQESQNYDLNQIKEAAGQMRSFLEELFGTGLSRTSPDVLDYLERLAIISHNVGLARFEGYFRALSDSYDGYFARKASFRTEELIGQMTRLYSRAGLLLQPQAEEKISALAGEFRADYLPAGNLNLIGITMEHFESQTGYEGDTIYFLEENTGKWYTYTNARPVIYDGKKRTGYREKSQAPWGLNLSFENLAKVRIRLKGAKCDGRRRLSSSQDTKGEILGESGLCVSAVQGWYYRDFGKLFAEQIGRQRREWLAEQEEAGENTEQTGAELVFVQPESCKKSEFSRTDQMLSLPLYDKKGREILVEVAYSRQEADTIRYLERLSEKEPPCFLGKIRLRDGKLRMYPVDLPDIREGDGGASEENPEAPGGIAMNSVNEGEAPGNSGKNSGNDAEIPGNNVEKTVNGQESSEKDAEEPEKNTVEPENKMEPRTIHKSKYQVMEELTGEIQRLAEELYQSGFTTAHDATLQGLKKAAGLTEQYGMEYLSGMLRKLAEEIEKSRHQMEKRLSAMAELYAGLDEYLYLCRQKTAYDRGAENYILIGPSGISQ